MNIPLGLGRTITALFTAAAGTIGTLVGTATATAAGTSPKYLGCYAQWWSTTFAAKCDGAAERHHFWLNGDCMFELDVEAGPFTVRRGFAGTVASRSCTFKVRRAWLGYS